EALTESLMGYMRPTRRNPPDGQPEICREETQNGLRSWFSKADLGRVCRCEPFREWKCSRATAHRHTWLAQRHDHDRRETDSAAAPEIRRRDQRKCQRFQALVAAARGASQRRTQR